MWQDVKEEDLENYFANFGRVTCINIMYDKNSGRHRGFAFVDFNDYDPVDKVLCRYCVSLCIRVCMCVGGVML